MGRQHPHGSRKLSSSGAESRSPTSTRATRWRRSAGGWRSSDLEVLEERIEADLALGRQTQLVAELQSLVREHPLRERFAASSCSLSTRSGRQAEALDVYRQARRRLSEELGLEPGEALKRLERAILEQDPALGRVTPSKKPRPCCRAAAPASHRLGAACTRGRRLRGDRNHVRAHFRLGRVWESTRLRGRHRPRDQQARGRHLRR